MSNKHITVKNKLENIDWRIVIAAIAGLTIVEVVAMFNGINGKLFSLVVAIIAGLGGWVLPTPNTKK